MKKRLIGLLLLMMMVATCFVGCSGGKKESNANGERIKITVGYPKADNTWTNDEYFKYITDKLNIDIEFKTLSADSAGEKARIWISSGSMPDVVYSDFLVDEYVQYGKQGMVRELPEGWEEKYPNLAFAMEYTGIMDSLREKGDGTIYGLVRPLDHYSAYTDDFRTAFENGENIREIMDQNEYKYIDKYGFAYRKDWAEQLGIETDYIMEYEDFLDMIRKIKEADLGGVGKNNVVGLAIDHTEAPNFFITAFNSSYKFFHIDEKTGKYVCGLLDDETTQGVIEYAKAYKEGLISPGFYTQKPADLNSLFCSQRSGIIFPRAEVSAVRSLNAEFAKANPGMNPEDCIGVCWVKSPDGKVHGREASNYYGAYYINPDISDEKLDRILALADYISSPEGGPQVRLGVPGVDYSEEDYSILREKNESGVYDTLDKKYPSYEFFRNFLNPLYNQTIETDVYARECMDNLTNEKRKHELSLLDWDDKRDAYAADDYVKFNAAYEVNAMFAEIVVSDGDIEKNWSKKRAEIKEAAKSVIKNMNEALLGK